MVAQFHTEEDMVAIGQWLNSLVPGKKPKKLFLQSFVDRDSVVFSGLSAPTATQITRFAEVLTPYVDEVAVRGVETQ